jgi:hypothetical protein
MYARFIGHRPFKRAARPDRNVRDPEGMASREQQCKSASCVSGQARCVGRRGFVGPALPAVFFEGVT